MLFVRAFEYEREAYYLYEVDVRTSHHTVMWCDCSLRAKSAVPLRRLRNDLLAINSKCRDANERESAHITTIIIIFVCSFYLRVQAYSYSENVAFDYNDAKYSLFIIPFGLLALIRFTYCYCLKCARVSRTNSKRNPSAHE